MDRHQQDEPHSSVWKIKPEEAIKKIKNFGDGKDTTPTRSKSERVCFRNTSGTRTRTYIEFMEAKTTEGQIAQAHHAMSKMTKTIHGQNYEDHQPMKTISPEIGDVASIVGSDNREG